MINDDQDADAVAAVVQALKALRGEHGVLTVQKFSRQPVLVQLLGDGDLLEGFMAFKRELGRLQRGNKYEAAVAYSIGADYESVLDRLQATADALSEGDPKDQRTARHWSDRGMKPAAKELVAFAHLHGNLGRHLVGIALHDGEGAWLNVQIVEVVPAAQKPPRAPLVTLVQQTSNGSPTTTESDLEQVQPDHRELDDEHITTAYTLQLALPADGTRLLTSLSVMARGALAPTFFLDPSELRVARVRLAVHRNLAVVEFVPAAV